MLLVKVHVDAGGSLRSHIDPHTTLEQVGTVGEAIGRLPLPRDVALIIMVNGRIAHWTTPLQDGDVLQLLPTIGGGAHGISTEYHSRGEHERRRNMGQDPARGSD